MAEISEKETQKVPATNISPTREELLPTQRLQTVPQVRQTKQKGASSPKQGINIASNPEKKAPVPVKQGKNTENSKKQALLRQHNLVQTNLLLDRCKQLGLTLFMDDRVTIHSLGITSAIEGEGKTFLSLMMAKALAEEGFAPITLLECNWEHPCLHEYFNIEPTPGLAEWVRGECDETEIRRQISSNLAIIPAGNGQDDAVRILRQLRDQGIQQSLNSSSDILIIDLPAVLTAAYGSLAASLPEALLLVTQAAMTPAPLVAEAMKQLADLPIKSIILNQVKSKIPRWIRQLL